jgi:hypothetical protein
MDMDVSYHIGYHEGICLRKNGIKLNGGEHRCRHVTDFVCT